VTRQADSSYLCLKVLQSVPPRLAPYQVPAPPCHTPPPRQATLPQHQPTISPSSISRNNGPHFRPRRQPIYAPTNSTPHPYPILTRRGLSLTELYPSPYRSHSNNSLLPPHPPPEFHDRHQEGVASTDVDAILHKSAPDAAGTKCTRNLRSPRRPNRSTPHPQEQAPGGPIGLVLHAIWQPIHPSHHPHHSQNTLCALLSGPLPNRQDCINNPRPPGGSVCIHHLPFSCICNNPSRRPPHVLWP